LGISSPVEEILIQNTILFRSRNPGSTQDLKPFRPEFVAASTKYFGMKFYDLEASGPTEEDLRRVRPAAEQLPDAEIGVGIPTGRPVSR
jgi:hypothetical protein